MKTLGEPSTHLSSRSTKHSPFIGWPPCMGSTLLIASFSSPSGMCPMLFSRCPSPTFIFLLTIGFTSGGEKHRFCGSTALSILPSRFLNLENTLLTRILNSFQMRWAFRNRRKNTKTSTKNSPFHKHPKQNHCSLGKSRKLRGIWEHVAAGVVWPIRLDNLTTKWN